MSGAINRSLISTYFLTIQTYKRMCLTTRVYGNRYIPCHFSEHICNLYHRVFLHVFSIVHVSILWFNTKSHV